MAPGGMSPAELDAVARKITIAFAAVGIIYVGALIAKLFTYTIAWVRPGRKLRKYGQWAVVTGATDGIGKAYCYEMAKQKLDIVVMGRTESKVKELCSALETKYGVKTLALVEDFSAADQAMFDRVAGALKGLDVGVLINNVGMSYPHAKYFTEVDSKLIDDLIRINIYTTTQMTKTVLPGMEARRRGAVVFIGSGSATVLPTDPLYGVYAGAKGYVEQFARALAVECKPRGVDVQLQAPLFVATKMAKIRKGSLTAPAPAVYARWGTGAIGYETVTTPYWVHTIMWGIISLMPLKLWDAIRMSQVRSIRKRALAKKGKKSS